MPAILQAPDGVTWIGTASGLIRYQAGALKWFGEKEGLKVPDVRAIAESPDGTVWFGMLGGGLGRLQNGKLEQFFKGDGLPSDYVQSLHLGTDGALWIGTYGERPVPVEKRTVCKNQRHAGSAEQLHLRV